MIDTELMILQIRNKLTIIITQLHTTKYLSPYDRIELMKIIAELEGIVRYL